MNSYYNRTSNTKSFVSGSMLEFSILRNDYIVKSKTNSIPIKATNETRFSFLSLSLPLCSFLFLLFFFIIKNGDKNETKLKGHARLRVFSYAKIVNDGITRLIRV